jgi:hypothetical protein
VGGGGLGGGELGAREGQVVGELFDLGSGMVPVGFGGLGSGLSGAGSFGGLRRFGAGGLGLGLGGEAGLFGFGGGVVGVGPVGLGGDAGSLGGQPCPVGGRGLRAGFSASARAGGVVTDASSALDGGGVAHHVQLLDGLAEQLGLTGQRSLQALDQQGGLGPGQGHRPPRQQVLLGGRQRPGARAGRWRAFCRLCSVPPTTSPQ